MPMLVDRSVRHESRAAHYYGAQEKTRTFTTLRPQVPETCASTNSATWATGLPPPIGSGGRGEAGGARCNPRGEWRQQAFIHLKSRFWLSLSRSNSKSPLA